MRIINAVDLFCGAGGTSTGLTRACKKMNLELKLLAINHWNVAIATDRKCCSMRDFTSINHGSIERVGLRGIVNNNLKGVIRGKVGSESV